MKTILQVGMKRTRKTTETKKLLRTFSNLKKKVFDVQNEYGFPLTTKKQFLEEAINCKNSVIVFEEATIFFSNNKQTEEMINLLISTAHKGNVIVLNFHSWKFVPTEIITLVDYFFIRKSNDAPSYIDIRFREMPHIKDAWHKVMAMPLKWDVVKVKNTV